MNPIKSDISEAYKVQVDCLEDSDSYDLHSYADSESDSDFDSYD